MNHPLRDRCGDVSTVLAHDWLTGMRGGERVLEQFCAAFPRAPLGVLLADPASVCETIRNRPRVTSWLDRVPGIQRHYRWALPLFPAAAASVRLPGPARLMLSTSHCVAKSFRPPPGARHLCYCFTPMRYAWLFHDEYFGRRGLRRWMTAPVLWALRRWDRGTNGQVDQFVAISGHIRERILQFYGRESRVVYPPVDTERCRPGSAREAGAYDLIVSALVPYKRVDLAVRAYGRLGFPLRIVGTGTQYAALAANAPPNVSFLGWRDDDALTALYRGCRLLVFPGQEDFGIVPLEAQACGRPVVAYGRGGARETVLENQTGVFFDHQTEADLIAAVSAAADHAWDRDRIRAHAEGFGMQRFLNEMADAVEDLLRVEPQRTVDRVGEV